MREMPKMTAPLYLPLLYQKLRFKSIALEIFLMAFSTTSSPLNYQNFNNYAY